MNIIQYDLWDSYRRVVATEQTKQDIRVDAANTLARLFCDDSLVSQKIVTDMTKWENEFAKGCIYDDVR